MGHSQRKKGPAARQCRKLSLETHLTRSCGTVVGRMLPMTYQHDNQLQCTCEANRLQRFSTNRLSGNKVPGTQSCAMLVWLFSCEPIR